MTNRLGIAVLDNITAQVYVFARMGTGDLARPLRIEGLGRYLPRTCVSNAELSALANMDYHAIHERCGVYTRHHADRASGETAPFMGARAAEEALANAGCTLADIDLLISASGTSHQFIPDNAVFIQQALGAGGSGLPCYSVHTSCLSFLTALDIAASHLSSGRHGRILVVTSEVASAGLNFQDPETGPLFGDGAAAAVVARAPEGSASCVHRALFESYGDDAHLTGVPGGGTNRPAGDPEVPREDGFFRMNGVGLLKRALRHVPPLLERFAPALARPDQTVYVLHQASKAGFGLVDRLAFPPERVVRTLAEYGNCVGASLPLTLYKAVDTGVLKRGDECVMIGTAAGLTYGALHLTY